VTKQAKCAVGEHAASTFYLRMQVIYAFQLQVLAEYQKGLLFSANMISDRQEKMANTSMYMYIYITKKLAVRIRHVLKSWHCLYTFIGRIHYAFSETSYSKPSK
jgi:hypothetical protein